MKAFARIAMGAVGAGAAGVVLLVALIVVEDSDPTATESSTLVLANVPAEFQPWIARADGACPEPEMTPALLASQLHRESAFTPSATSPAGAEGPAQFMPATWATWGRDDDLNGRDSPRDIGDSVMAQGRFMCSLLGEAKRSGYADDPRALALAGYNAGWGAVQRFRGVPPVSFARGETHRYVKSIMAGIPRFQSAGTFQFSGSGRGPDALRRASVHLGTPYSWGGGTPSGPSPGFCDGANGYLRGTCSASSTTGFDCSSLAQYAYWPSLQLPRVASAQYGATSHHAVARRNLRPGDLLFWSHGGSGAIYHVALYAGEGNVLHAPRTGKNVEVVPLASAMPENDYYGATRP
ncbi:NlpC/P60 family protein [Streptomyces sp. NPDC058486]|uniref:C40 family peptidase n=1 Tax=Streptomyces sp. NPDC058486 TaxID=3346526 RepID=UPI003666AFFA